MPQDEKDRMFLDLNSVLVKFWIGNGRPDKEIRIELLERMLNWYKKMGYATMERLEEEDLKKEIARTYHDGSVADTSEMDHNDYENIAHYFAEWGAEHLKP